MISERDRGLCRGPGRVTEEAVSHHRLRGSVGAVVKILDGKGCGRRRARLYWQKTCLGLLESGCEVLNAARNEGRLAGKEFT